MPDELFILKSWEDQLIVFRNHLQTIRQRPAKKAVHDIRVAVKKIRSYLRLRQVLTGEKWNEEFNGIKIFFKTLGRQRDIEMTLSLLSAYHRREKIFLAHFKKILQTNGRLTRRWSKQVALEFNEEELQPLSNAMHNSLAALPDEQVINKISELAVITLKKVRKLSANFKKNIHEIRKLLKDLYYWLKTCPENPVSNLLRMKLLEKILTDLGRWQDYFIFLAKLKDFRKEFSVRGSDEFALLEICEKKMKMAQNRLLLKIKIQGAFLFLK